MEVGSNMRALNNAQDVLADILAEYEALGGGSVPGFEPIYAIGDTGPAGGIVFYITDGGLHGLEAAPEDQSSGANWGCPETNIPGAEGTEVGTGQLNTEDILAGCNDSPIAASVAADYTLGDFNDWFLPSKDELNEMYLNIYYDGDNFPGGLYWSSSENDANTAWVRGFTPDSTFQRPASKGNHVSFSVRAVRAF